MLPCFVTCTYIMEFPLSLGEKPALCGLLLGFKAFEASGVFKKSSFAGRSSCLDCLTYCFPVQLLTCRRSAGRSLSDTLGTSSLVEDRSRDQKCMVSLFLFRSNLRDLRDQHDML